MSFYDYVYRRIAATPSTAAATILFTALLALGGSSLFSRFSSSSNVVHPGLETLLRGITHDDDVAIRRLKEIYPETFYEGGGYVSLPMGRTRYWIVGPEDGAKVVMINGLMTPSAVWAEIVPKLLHTGKYRILLYDLYGRGYSEAPQTVYNSRLYITQLALLLQFLKWEKCSLVGLSMGGGIAAAFAATFPWLVTNKVAFICPAGVISETDLPLGVRLITSPLGVYFSSTSLVKSYIKRHTARAVPQSASRTAQLEEIGALQRAVLPYYNNAVFSSIRMGPVVRQHKAFDAVGRNKNLDVLLIWGTSDSVVPYRLSADLLRRMPQSRLITIEGGNHDIVVSHSEQVFSALLEFL